MAPTPSGRRVICDPWVIADPCGDRLATGRAGLALDGRAARRYWNQVSDDDDKWLEMLDRGDGRDARGRLLPGRQAVKRLARNGGKAAQAAKAKRRMMSLPDLEESFRRMAEEDDGFLAHTSNGLAWVNEQIRRTADRAGDGEAGPAVTSLLCHACVEHVVALRQRELGDYAAGSRHATTMSRLVRDATELASREAEGRAAQPAETPMQRLAAKAEDV